MHARPDTATTLQTVLSALATEVSELNQTVARSVAQGFGSHAGRPWAYVALLLAAFWAYSLLRSKPSKYPTINYDGKAWTYWQAKKSFLLNAKELLLQGSRKFAGPFNIITFTSRLLILPPDMIDAINAESDLSFQKFVREDFLSDLKTFQPMRTPPPGMFEELVMKGLTRALPKYTRPLSLEMTKCLDDTWGQVDKWREVAIMQEVLHWVARLSNRIFLGDAYTTNTEWLRISTSFTVNLFTALGVTRMVPRPLRGLVDWISPLNRRVRRDYRKAASIIEPEFKARREEITAAAREGRKPNIPDDSIEWARSAAHGRPYNEVNLQLGLAIAAIHTTSDLLTQAILNLCAHPEAVAPLRQEIVDVLGKFGWQKVALTELRLLDSFFKETQRLKPVGMAVMHRSAVKDVELPGGVRIGAGDHIAVSSHRMWDPEEYKDPESFDAFRFVERRKLPGYENKSLLVATSPDHMAFSHGKHACPGRFFAANEVKIAMVHVLLKYDLRISDPSYAKWESFGANMIPNRKAKVMIKSRVPELDLDRLAMEL